MRFLADESCDFAAVRALRAAGHDVLAVAELSPRAADSQVIRLATSQERILLTEDRHFGQLVFAHQRRTHGVIYIRFASTARQRVVTDLVQLVEQPADHRRGCFGVSQPGRIRISRTRL